MNKQNQLSDYARNRRAKGNPGSADERYIVMLSSVILVLIALANVVKAVCVLTGARKAMQEAERWQNRADTTAAQVRAERLKAA